jgi:hypothetical protein
MQGLYVTRVELLKMVEELSLTISLLESHVHVLTAELEKAGVIKLDAIELILDCDEGVEVQVETMRMHEDILSGRASRSDATAKYTQFFQRRTEIRRRAAMSKGGNA